MRWNPAPNNAFCTWLANLLNRWPEAKEVGPSTVQAYEATWPAEENRMINAEFKKFDAQMREAFIAGAREP